MRSDGSHAEHKGRVNQRITVNGQAALVVAIDFLCLRESLFANCPPAHGRYVVALFNTHINMSVRYSMVN